MSSQDVNGNSNQRRGCSSNVRVGCDFTQEAKEFLEEREGIELKEEFPIKFGVADKKKDHKFDLGSEDPRIIIECKSHTWTKSGSVPSAKITIWNEAMYYFLLAPKNYRKIFFCLKHFSEKQGKTLAEYYIKHKQHLIPPDVEIYEYCKNKRTAKKCWPKPTES